MKLRENVYVKMKLRRYEKWPANNAFYGRFLAANDSRGIFSRRPAEHDYKLYSKEALKLCWWAAAKMGRKSNQSVLLGRHLIVPKKEIETLEICKFSK